MRYDQEHKEKTRRNILDAALEKFRTEGYNGIGVGGISQAAGVTTGAFYSHFESKALAFEAVVSEGLELLYSAIQERQKIDGGDWLMPFVRWYFSFPEVGARKQGDNCLPIEGGCALPTLSPEVARADAYTRKIFEKRVRQIAEMMNQGLGVSGDLKKVWPVLSLMIGGVTLARAVHDDQSSRAIADSVVEAIRNLAED